MVSGTFGDGPTAFNFGTLHKVDPSCSIKDVNVLDDYSCVLVLEDISYNQLSQIKVFKMQLVERNDGKKWFVWIAQGIMSESDLNQTQEDEIDTSQLNTKQEEFYVKVEAQAHFEKLFFNKTANKWTDKDYLKQKPGKFKILNKEQNRKLINEAQEMEKELVHVIAESQNKFKTSIEDEEVFALLNEIFDVAKLNKYLVDCGLDTTRIPLGRLTYESIKRAHSLLG